MNILKNILGFITDPKNTRMLLLAGVVILILLFLHQCNRTQHFKGEVEKQKQETQRIENNYDAAKSKIKQYKVNDSTWRAEKNGFEITIEELENEYAELLADFKVEKNKPPKVIIRTEYIIKDSIRNVLVFVETDSAGNKSMKFGDSLYHDSTNYRIINGEIPYDIVLNEADSTHKLVPGSADIDLTIGMNLDLGLFQDKDTKKIYIQADTKYPGITFTRLDGASILDNSDNKEILRELRKPWSIGLNLGYGAIIDVGSGQINTGPYFGLGLSYSPKFLQWGK